MNKFDIVIGFLIGIICSLLGTYIFVEYFSEYHFLEGIKLLKSNGQLGKLIALGSVLNVGMFFLLLHFKKDLMARGIIFAIITTTIFTIFI